MISIVISGAFCPNMSCFFCFETRNGDMARTLLDPPVDYSTELSIYGLNMLTIPSINL